MIQEFPTNHRASVDKNGDIILPGGMREVPIPSGSEREMEMGMWYAPQIKQLEEMEAEEYVESELSEDPIAFELPDTKLTPSSTIDVAAATTDVIDESSIGSIESTSKIWTTVRDDVFHLVKQFADETESQYHASVQDSLMVSRGIANTMKQSIKNFWSFVTQPVWIPGKHNAPKQYGRGALFLLDTVRFGGTFATLFLVLFVGLNFQSFWSIASSYVHPLSDITTGRKLAQELDDNIAEKLKHIPSLATAGGAHDLVAYLPLVGPPENRLIIPKLNINVPIITPATDNLIKENWTALEEDIQSALQDGVVHYPGTARPGQAGDFFVTGHSSYFPWAAGNYKSIFARLGELNVNDEYWVYYGGDKYRYVVTHKKEIQPTDVSVLDQPVNKRVATLMTCTPLGTTLRRLIISAQEVDPVTGKPMKVGQHRVDDRPRAKVEMLSI